MPRNLSAAASSLVPMHQLMLMPAFDSMIAFARSLLLALLESRMSQGEFGRPRQTLTCRCAHHQY